MKNIILCNVYKNTSYYLEEGNNFGNLALVANESGDGGQGAGALVAGGHGGQALDGAGAQLHAQVVGVKEHGVHGQGLIRNPIGLCFFKYTFYSLKVKMSYLTFMHVYCIYLSKHPVYRWSPSFP